MHGDGDTKMMLESDSLFMILECQSKINNYSEMCSLIAEIRSLQARFEDCQLQHVYREQNIPTHLSAKHALYLDRVVMWDMALEFVSQSIWHDYCCIVVSI